MRLLIFSGYSCDIYIQIGVSKSHREARANEEIAEPHKPQEIRRFGGAVLLNHNHEYAPSIHLCLNGPELQVPVRNLETLRKSSADGGRCVF